MRKVFSLLIYSVIIQGGVLNAQNICKPKMDAYVDSCYKYRSLDFYESKDKHMLDMYSKYEQVLLDKYSIDISNKNELKGMFEGIIDESFDTKKLNEEFLKVSNGVEAYKTIMVNVSPMRCYEVAIDSIHCLDEYIGDVYDVIVEYEKSSDLNRLIFERNVIKVLPDEYFSDIRYRAIFMGLIVGYR
jgi:hypothetical protein